VRIGLASVKTEIYKPQPITLPKEAPIHRVFPFKGPNQPDWIDDTIFYDVFYKHDNTAIICIGPPLLSLEGALKLQQISCNGKRLRYCRIKFSINYNLIAIKVPRFLRRELTVQLKFHFNLFEKVAEISRNHPPTGHESNLLTLVTVQKDNPLGWVRDWVRWHNRMHGVGRLILYDNGSREYGYDQLIDTCMGEEENFQTVLVNWDFPWTQRAWASHRGWFGGPWPQKAALNHCYLKYGDCGWLLNLDIDEYLVAEDASSLQDYIRQKSQHYLPFRQRTIQGIGPEKPLAERSFRDFLWHKEYPSFHKYACQCNRPFLMGLHSIEYGRFRRFRFRAIEAKLSSIGKRIRKLFNNLPRERFWIYHFALLASPCAVNSRKWGPNFENRMLYRDKAYFETQGLEIIYDDTMIKQAEKYGL